MKLNDPAMFSETLLGYFMEEGWQSLSKRDLELLIFILLEKDGTIDQFASNHTVGKQLRLTPAKISALRKDSYARWRPLLGIDSEDMIKHILKNTLTEKKLASGARYAAEKTAREGFLALMVEHPDYRAELEEALKNLDAIPVYERNPQVILIHSDTLFELAKQFDLLNDFKAIQQKLSEIYKEEPVKGLEDFLKKKAKDLTWEDVRSALSATTAKVLAKQVESISLVSLLQLAMPFLI